MESLRKLPETAAAEIRSGGTVSSRNATQGGGSIAMRKERPAQDPARELERVLIRRMAAGEEVAFEEFCDLYVPVMYRFVQRCLSGDFELTREIVQTTLCKVLPKIETFRGEAALTTWLCSCCRNEIAGHFRKESRRKGEIGFEHEKVTAEVALQVGTGDGPERGLLRKEKSELVHEALDLLPAHYGKALEWKYLENLTVREIARRLDLGAKAAESLLTRARLAFRDGYSRLLAGVETAMEGGSPANPETAVEP